MKKFAAFALLAWSVSAFGQVKLNTWWETPKGRQAHAAKLYTDFKALYDQIPTLSPAEERWLKTEYDDTIAANGGHFTERAVNVMDSSEWDIRVAKPHAMEIDYELSQLQLSLNATEEARHWTQLASLLMDNQFWQSVQGLEKREVVHKKNLAFLGTFPGPTATLWAQQILNEVVIPYFSTKR